MRYHLFNQQFDLAQTGRQRAMKASLLFSYLSHNHCSLAEFWIVLLHHINHNLNQLREKWSRKTQRLAQVGCATDETMRRDASTVPGCVHHLMELARKQRRAGQLTIAKVNFQRALQVNGYLGEKQDEAVTKEAQKAIAAIGRAQR